MQKKKKKNIYYRPLSKCCPLVADVKSLHNGGLKPERQGTLKKEKKTSIKKGY
ncbi:MAG: hypothetical protein O7D30_04655 [Rickettsia endosymbiont of Ixodes persulcatus]|nr:hypothetical protein [Rickettsia endosymbiont of Ixodes persulcatus]